jgi:hypothetical protein
VFSPATRGGGLRQEPSRGKSRRNLTLESVRGSLIAAGVGLLSTGGIKGLPAIAGTQFEGRSILEPRFYIFETATETSTYIQTLGPLKDYTQSPLGDPDTIDI